MCQKRPTYAQRVQPKKKKRLILYTRDEWMCQKRPMHVSKETNECVKRDLCMCQKRPVYVSKETYICAKSPTERDSRLLDLFLFLGTLFNTHYIALQQHTTTHCNSTLHQHNTKHCNNTPQQHKLTHSYLPCLCLRKHLLRRSRVRLRVYGLWTTLRSSVCVCVCVCDVRALSLCVYVY